MSERLLIMGAAQVLTCADGAPDLVGAIPGGSVLLADDRILAVGDTDAIRRDERGAGAEVLDARGAVVMPGFVDCHTHVVFGGTRVQEYVSLCAGLPVPVQAPQGILGTMAATRALDAAGLADAAEPRVREMIAHGTTTIESKTGYGLDRETELAMLEANRLLAQRLDVGVVSTYLGAHAFPPDVSHAEYVDQICETVPEVASRGLAEFCDVYCDEYYFTLGDTRRIFAAARASGLGVKLHLDAYSHTGAAALAAEFSAASVDHMNFTTPEELRALAGAGVTGVVMPLLDFAVAHPQAVQPAALAALGIRVALATDCCPGCMATSMQLAIQHACRTGALTVEAAIQAATLNAAHAVGRAGEVGSLAPGKSADLLILDTDRYEDLAYRLGHNAVRTVIRGGRVVARDGVVLSMGCGAQ